MRDWTLILMYMRVDVTWELVWDIYVGDCGLIFAESDPDRRG